MFTGDPAWTENTFCASLGRTWQDSNTKPTGIFTSQHRKKLLIMLEYLAKNGDVVQHLDHHIVPTGGPIVICQTHWYLDEFAETIMTFISRFVV